MFNTLHRWIPILSRFLSGQAIVQIINFVTALILIRLLPVNEYALFVIANFFLNIGSTGSDLNLSNALITYGAKIAGDRKELSGLFALIANMREKLFVLIILVICAIVPFTFKGHYWNYVAVAAVLLVVLLIVWFQQKITLRIMVLNIHHDSLGLFQTSMTGAVARLICTSVFCFFSPFAVVALLSILLGSYMSSWIVRKRCEIYLDEKFSANESYRERVNNYVFPMMPAAAYYLFQGQISIFLISIFGAVTAIAEVGALTRLGQIFALLGVLNGFLFQPMFSRIITRKEFIQKGFFVTIILIFFFGVILVSAYIKPDWWLMLLGNKYAELHEDVPLAFAGPIATYLYGIFFVMLISRTFTKGQNWYVGATLIAQILFITIVGVDTTHKALLLNFIGSLTSMIVELVLLFILLRNWR